MLWPGTTVSVALLPLLPSRSPLSFVRIDDSPRPDNVKGKLYILYTLVISSKPDQVVCAVNSSAQGTALVLLLAPVLLLLVLPSTAARVPVALATSLMITLQWSFMRFGADGGGGRDAAKVVGRTVASKFPTSSTGPQPPKSSQRVSISECIERVSINSCEMVLPVVCVRV